MPGDYYARTKSEDMLDMRCCSWNQNSDACVVTDDAGQGDLGQGPLLPLAERPSLHCHQNLHEGTAATVPEALLGCRGHPLSGAAPG